MRNNLDKLFFPSSIAVVGATDKKEKVGYAIFKNIISGGFKGKVYPVNKRLDYLEGYKVYHSVVEIPDEVDLAIISIPIRYVPELFDQLGKKKVPAAVVISAGGKEVGEEGRKIEEEIKLKARKYNIRFLGPNCLGFSNTIINLNANFGIDTPLKGETAFVSQSGALFTALMDWALEQRIGFSYAVSIGNMADIEFGELIYYLGKKKEVKNILVYMESLTNPHSFYKAVKEISLQKPVVVTKSGRAETGQRAAASHTGAIGGKDFLYTALFDRAGVLRTDTVLQLFDITDSFSKQSLPKGDKFVVITNAGGPGVMAADEFDRLGIKAAQLSEKTLMQLNEILPPVWSHGNPVDIIGDASPERYRKTLEIISKDNNVDGIIVIITPQFMTKPVETAKSLIEVTKKSDKPVYCVLMGGVKLKKARDMLESSNIPVFETPEEAVNTMYSGYIYNRKRNLVKQDNFLLNKKHPEYENVKKIIEHHLNSGKTVLTEYQTKQIISKYGIPINETVSSNNVEEIISFARKVGFPLVLKIDSPDILHKTEANCVITNIHTEDQIIRGYEEILRNGKKYKKDAVIYGVIAEKQVEGDYELIIGSSHDDLFGQYLMFGSGGIFVEALKDVSFSLVPLSEIFAKEMIISTKIYNLLEKGFRNKKPVDISRIINILMNISKLLLDFPQIKEMDINPLIVKEEEIYAVDGRMVLREKIGNNSVLISDIGGDN